MQNHLRKTINFFHSSLSSLLTARESDPEEVLKGLGFAGLDVLDNIPNRFLSSETRCQGINTKQFLGTLNVDSSYEVSVEQ